MGVLFSTTCIFFSLSGTRVFLYLSSLLSMSKSVIVLVDFKVIGM